LIRRRLAACRRYQQSPHRVNRHVSRFHVAPVQRPSFHRHPKQKSPERLRGPGLFGRAAGYNRSLPLSGRTRPSLFAARY